MPTYPRLTKEQLEALHTEFAEFLATHQITAKDWSSLKKSSPDKTEVLLDVFSKVVWEKVLEKNQYLEHISMRQWVLFKFEGQSASAIILKTTIDCSSLENRKKLQQEYPNYIQESFRSNKNNITATQQEKLNLIQQGAQFCDGNAYAFFKEQLNLKF